MYSDEDQYRAVDRRVRERDDLIVGLVTTMVPFLGVVILIVTFWLIARQ
jgi:hypothetical protein